MSSPYPVTVTAAVVVMAILLLVRFRLHPVVVLVAAAIVIGLLNGLGVEGTVDAVMGGFGNVLAKAGLLITFGVLIGSLLQSVGAIERIVGALLDRVGARRTPLALALACATVLQPIFIDVLIVILAPLVRRVAARIGPGGTARMATALTVGCTCGIMMVVPGFGAIALAGVLNVPLGRMLVLGSVVAVLTVALTTTIAGPLLARGWDPARDETSHTELVVAARYAARSQTDHSAPTELPGAGAEGRALPLPVVLAPLVGALVLIAAGAVAAALGLHAPVLALLSAPPIALLLGLLGTMAVVVLVHGRDGLDQPLHEGFRQIGLILVLTGVGGSLAESLSRTGLGRSLGTLFSADTAVPLVTVWLIAAVLHLAIGSATLAAITAAGVLAPVIPSAGLDPALVALAAGAGGLFAVTVTSNTFWLLQSLLGQSVRGVLKTFSVAVSAASVIALALVVLLGWLV